VSATKAETPRRPIKRVPSKSWSWFRQLRETLFSGRAQKHSWGIHSLHGYKKKGGIRSNFMHFLLKINLKINLIRKIPWDIDSLTPKHWV
jgi:hypothetical protein